MALIAGAVAVFAVPQFLKARIQTAELETKNLVTAVGLYRLNGGDEECPAPEALRARGVLKPDQKLTDPWGHPYKIVCESPHVGATSAGPDGIWGNEDDVASGLPPKKSDG